MADELLDYYNRELTYIRRLAAEFAEAHPKIAERLRLGPDDASDDPHVERLIEAFAYLTARVRHKLDDEFPEITELAPGRPLPALPGPDPVDGDRAVRARPGAEPAHRPATRSRAHTELETEPIQGEPCRFRTCYPVTLWPIELKSAVLAQAPLAGPGHAVLARRRPPCCGSVAELPVARRSSFAALAIDSLRFFLKGQPQHVYRLYELLFNNTIGVAAGRLGERPVDPLVLGRGLPAARSASSATRGCSPTRPARSWATGC